MCLSYLKRITSNQKYETGYEVYAVMALAAASSYVQYQASQEQADAQQKAAWANYNQQKNALQEQANQINSSAQNEVNERYKMEMIDKGAIRTASGEAGVAGLSLDRLINDADFQAQMDMQSIVENQSNKIKQNSLEERGAYSRYASSYNQADSSRGSALGTGLQIGAQAASTYYGSKSGTKASK